MEQTDELPEQPLLAESQGRDVPKLLFRLYLEENHRLADLPQQATVA
jgi:hypothetical protein